MQQQQTSQNINEEIIQKQKGEKGRQSENQTIPLIMKKIVKPGKKIQKIKYPPTGAWCSRQSCKKLIQQFLLKGRLINFNPTNGSQQQIDQFHATLLESLSNKARIEIIQTIVAKHYGIQNQPQVVVFFFKQNYDKCPEEGKTCLENLANLHMRMTLGKVYQLLDPKFFQELVELLVQLEQLEYTFQIDQIVEELLNQAQLSPNDNTIIQYFFINYCYREANDEMENMKETFNKWKSNYKKINYRRNSPIHKRYPNFITRNERMIHIFNINIHYFVFQQFYISFLVKESSQQFNYYIIQQIGYL